MCACCCYTLHARLVASLHYLLACPYCTLRLTCLGLHCIGMHASPLHQAMIKVESPLVCLCALHFIWNQNVLLIHWAILHGNAWLVVRESRIISLWVMNMIRGVIGAYIAWNTLPCLACPLLLSKIGSAWRFGRPALLSVDRQRMFGREHNV